MARCEGRKGAAISKYNEKMKATRDIVKDMPYKDKNVIAAVFADGKSYRISGCEGMDKAIESVRIIGKSEDGMYQVVWGNSNEVSVVSKAELSSRLDSYFGENKEAETVSHDDEER